MPRQFQQPYPESPKEAQEKRRVVYEWGKWLRQYRWRYWVTLTFADDINLNSALRRFAKWRRELRMYAGEKLGWFAAFEYGAAELLHIHVLLYGPKELTGGILRHTWKYGLSHVVRYKPRGKAAYYVAKVVVDRRAHYDISRTLTPRKGHRR